jgi:hypothetical protein
VDGDARLLARLFAGVISVALDEGAPRLPIAVSVDDGFEVAYAEEAPPDQRRLGLVVAEELAATLGGQLVAEVSGGTVTLRFELPLEPARAA